MNALSHATQRAMKQSEMADNTLIRICSDFDRYLFMELILTIKIGVVVMHLSITTKYYVFYVSPKKNIHAPDTNMY